MRALKHKVLLAILVVFLATFGLTACDKNKKTVAGESSIEAIKKRGTIRIAVFGDLLPVGFKDKNGDLQGYDVYLAKRIAKDLLGDESKVEFVVVNADERVDALKSGKVDIILANFTKTPEREKVVDFAKPYMKVSVGVVSTKSALITEQAELSGKRVIVTKGTVAAIYFTEKYPEVRLEKYDTKEQQFAALENGQGEALAEDNSYLFSWVKNNPDYQVGIKQIGEVSTINPAVKKGDAKLKEWIDNEITKLEDEGFFQKAFDETLKPFYSEDVKAADVIIK